MLKGGTMTKVYRCIVCNCFTGCWIVGAFIPCYHCGFQDCLFGFKVQPDKVIGVVCDKCQDVIWNEFNQSYGGV